MAQTAHWMFHIIYWLYSIHVPTSMKHVNELKIQSQMHKTIGRTLRVAAKLPIFSGIILFTGTKLLCTVLCIRPGKTIHGEQCI